MPPETSDLEISAELLGKSGKEKNSKGGKKTRKIANGRREKFQNEERTLLK